MTDRGSFHSIAGTSKPLRPVTKHRERIKINHSSDRDHAYLADRSVGWPLLGASLAATTIGGTSTVVLAAYIMVHGLSGLWLDIPLGISLLVSGFFLAVRVRATGAFSIAGIARQKYGNTFGTITSVLVLMAELAWFALLTLAGASLVQGMTGLSHPGAILAVAAAFSVYTVMGGQNAVIITDLWQLCIVMLFGLGIPAFMVAVRGIHPEPGLLSFPTGPGIGGIDAFGLILMMGLPGLVGGDVYGRLLSARTPRDAARASVMAGFLKLLAAGCVAVIALGGEGSLDETFRTVLSPVLYHAAVFGILMAVMSSADSVLITGATVLHTDLMPRLNASPRLVAALVAVAGTALALAAGNVVAVMQWSYTVFSAGAPLPLLAALLLKRTPPPLTANLSVIIGGGTAALLKLLGNPAAFLIGLGASMGILLSGTVLNNGRRRV